MLQRAECDEKLLKIFNTLGEEAEKAKEPEKKGELAMYMIEIYKTLFREL